MRCNQCNKFVSYNEPEVEESQQADVTVNESTDPATKEVTVSFTVAGSIAVRLTCAECGDSLKESEVEYECESDTVKLPEGHRFVDGSASWSDNGPSEETRTEGTGRGLKTFYGFSLDGSIDYQTEPADGEGEPKDAEPFSMTCRDDVQASSMDEVQ